MKIIILIFFLLIILFSTLFIIVINDSNDKDHTKYHGFDIFYDTNLEKHRKIIKLQKKLLLKKDLGSDIDVIKNCYYCYSYSYKCFSFYLYV